MSLPLTPPKGTQDRFPPEFTIRKYIFDTRRTVCLSYGYSEYLAPLVENADLYRAKSGEDVGGSELTLISDRGGRDIAIRPEMTPSVTRMVASQYPQLPKPIRWFSIANFYRNERPQRGRNREFWQLNIDLFGAETIAADLEIIQLSIDLMKKFGAPKNSFSLKLNHRHLISDFLIMVCGTDADTKSLTRLLDKYTKLSKADFAIAVAELGCSPAQIADIVTFMEVTSIDQLLKTFPKLAGPATEQLSSLITTLQSLGYDEVEFSSGLMRGFDYYDGIVFEVFDKHPENNRALFGGGRYNGLAGIFGKNSFPAVWCAPGDEPMRLFLESWGLLGNAQKNSPEMYFLPLLDETYRTASLTIAQELRAAGHNVQVGLEPTKLIKAEEYARKNGITHLVICEGNGHTIKVLA